MYRITVHTHNVNYFQNKKNHTVTWLVHDMCQTPHCGCMTHEGTPPGSGSQPHLGRVHDVGGAELYGACQGCHSLQFRACQLESFQGHRAQPQAPHCTGAPAGETYKDNALRKQTQLQHEIWVNKDWRYAEEELQKHQMTLQNTDIKSVLRGRVHVILHTATWSSARLKCAASPRLPLRRSIPARWRPEELHHAWKRDPEIDAVQQPGSNATVNSRNRNADQPVHLNKRWTTKKKVTLQQVSTWLWLWPSTVKERSGAPCTSLTIKK